MRCWNRGIRKILSTDQAVSILMTVTDEEKFNVGLTSPLKPRDNCIFVVNAKLLGHRDDVLCDSSGVWDAAQGAKSHYFQKDASGTVSKITRKAYATSADAVHFKRRAYKNQNAPDFSRIYWFAEDGRCDYVMVQYFFKGDPHDFEPKAHKNSKLSCEPYRRTYKSTLQTIQDSGKDQSKSRYHLQVRARTESFDAKGKFFIRAMVIRGGGSGFNRTVLDSSVCFQVLNLEQESNPAQGIRNKKQIHNHTASAEVDNISLLMAKCKGELEKPNNRFIREVSAAPKLAIFLASTIQLGDLARFCTVPRKFCILSFDTTFNIGPYDVTIVVYRHLMLCSESAKVGIHPVKIGAVYIHHGRTEAEYSRFMYLLKQECPELKHLQAS